MKHRNSLGNMVTRVRKVHAVLMIGLELQFFKSDAGAWEGLCERMHVVDEAEKVVDMANTHCHKYIGASNPSYHF